MDKDKLDLEVRLAAIEYVLIHTAKVALLAATGGQPFLAANLAQQMRKAANATLDGQTLKGVEPVLADHFADEVRIQVDRLSAELLKTLAGAASG